MNNSFSAWLFWGVLFIFLGLGFAMLFCLLFFGFEVQALGCSLLAALVTEVAICKLLMWFFRSSAEMICCNCGLRFVVPRRFLGGEIVYAGRCPVCNQFNLARQQKTS